LKWLEILQPGDLVVTPFVPSPSSFLWFFLIIDNNAKEARALNLRTKQVSIFAYEWMEYEPKSWLIYREGKKLKLSEDVSCTSK